MVPLGQILFPRVLLIQGVLPCSSRGMDKKEGQFQSLVAVHALARWFLECYMAMCELLDYTS